MLNESVFRTFFSQALEERLQDGISYALKLGAIGAEIFINTSISHTAKIQNRKLQDLSISKRGGIGIRILRAKKDGLSTGIAASTNLAKDNFHDIVYKAWQLSDLGDSNKWISQANHNDNITETINNYDNKCDKITNKDRVQFATVLENEARNNSKKVSTIRESIWTDGIHAKLLMTQKGIRAYNISSLCSASIDLAVTNNNDQQSAWHWDVSKSHETINLKNISIEAVKKGELKLNPSRLKSGRYNIILHPEVTVEIFKLIASMLSAELVLKQKSLFTNKIGEKIASQYLTLIDDGKIPHGIGSQIWDDEGSITQNNVLIKDGILHTYLHTLQTAAEMQTLPTSSAGRTIGSNPGVKTFNLYPLTGHHNIQDLYKLAGKSILITEILGLHTINPISGDLSVGACGVQIQNNELSNSIDQITIAGNLKDFLKQIVAVGNDFKWYGNNAGLSILLSDISIGGI